jgi:putative zinc finger/helix-turn-helix YgiT family protein
MARRNDKERKSRPFPWPCSNCCTRTVVPVETEYTAKVKHDGTIYELYFPALEVPRCQTCGETVITTAVDEKINNALRERLRLLTPGQIRKGIEQLGLKQQEVAERLGVAPETISRWVNGALIQSRAMDNLLRLYFALPEVRAVLRGAEQDPNLGIVVDQGPTPDAGKRFNLSQLYEQVDEGSPAPPVRAGRRFSLHPDLEEAA